VPCAPTVLQILERAYAVIKRAIEDENDAECAAAAALFHRTIVIASGNGTFLRTWDALHWEIRTRVAFRTFRDRNIDTRPFLDMLGRVLDLLKTGDGMAAGQVLRDTLDKVLAVHVSDAAQPQPRKRRIRKS